MFPAAAQSDARQKRREDADAEPMLLVVAERAKQCKAVLPSVQAAEGSEIDPRLRTRQHRLDDVPFAHADHACGFEIMGVERTNREDGERAPGKQGGPVAPD